MGDPTWWLFVCCKSPTVTTTRAISTVAREEASKCSVLSAAVSPDGQVLFLLDEGVGQVIRLELESGNCRSFAKDLSCESLYCKHLQPIKINPENFQTKLLDSPSLQTMSFSITLMTALWWPLWEWSSRGSGGPGTARPLQAVRCMWLQLGNWWR